MILLMVLTPVAHNMQIAHTMQMHDNNVIHNAETQTVPVEWL